MHTAGDGRVGAYSSVRQRFVVDPNRNLGFAKLLRRDRVLSTELCTERRHQAENGFALWFTQLSEVFLSRKPLWYWRLRQT
jgi:hypothetical protein